MNFAKSDRLSQLPPYLFVELDRKKAEAISKGVDVIDLGIGDPDLPTPDFVIEKMIESIKNSENHRYPSSMGSKKFRNAAASWCKKRFGLEFDLETQVACLIGSKEGIAHFPIAFLNPGDVVLVPTPGYPVYHIGTLFCNAQTYFLPLLAKNNFLPDLDSIPEDILKKAKILWLNYPNNPTAAIAPDEFYKKAIEFAHKNNIIICHDAAYSEMTYDGYVAKSFFEFDGAMDVGIEFHSHSKTYNMTGWRIGFAVGNNELIAGLKHAKSNVDSGQFNAVQEAGIAAMESDGTFVNEMKAVYTRRRDVFVNSLRDIGLNAPFPKATFYVWCPVPENFTSASFSSFALEKAGIVCTPGNGFGDPGEGYVRFALTVSEARLKEAVERLKKEF
jgi:LL-diaminopimelate aminotransferase